MKQGAHLCHLLAFRDNTKFEKNDTLRKLPLEISTPQGSSDSDTVCALSDVHNLHSQKELESSRVNEILAQCVDLCVPFTVDLRHCCRTSFTGRTVESPLETKDAVFSQSPRSMGSSGPSALKLAAAVLLLEPCTGFYSTLPMSSPTGHLRAPGCLLSSFELSAPERKRFSCNMYDHLNR